MPSSLALLLTFVFCGLMLRWVNRDMGRSSPVLWLPVIWIFFIGTRFPGQWLSMFGLYSGVGWGEEGNEGSILDAVFFLVLILSGIAVLARRDVKLGEFCQQNKWVVIFLVYCLLAVLWSDYPFVAFKRWVKVLGHPVMALVIISSVSPMHSFQVIMSRCAILMIPLSVVFIKYYPEYGRGFDPWTGQGYNMGMSLNKNELGYVCMIFGVYFVWQFLLSRGKLEWRKRMHGMAFSIGFLIMILWLFRMANSATSLIAFVIGASLVIGLGMSFISKKSFTLWFVGMMAVAVLLDRAFGVYGSVVRILGRNVSLTDRTEVWKDAVQIMDSPLLGVGFESFWLGGRREELWDKWWWHPNQAHNGYIETYLNLGVIGLVLLVIMILVAFKRISNRLIVDFDFARIQMGYLIAILVYNYTEATFKGVSLVWTLFNVAAVMYIPRACALRPA